MRNQEFEQPYQILNQDGQVTGPLPEGLEPARLLEWYRTMWLTRLFSNKLVALQRQGRATTWIPSNGQEAIAVGLATPLLAQDWLTASPREMGGYLLKGVTPAAIAYFCRGFPPPPELAGPDVRCLPFTIVIGTQTLHSAGLAMAAKIKKEDSVVVGTCGDGATSEGDFSEALNFAGVFQSPLVMVVVNNGWAISVPSHKQYAAKHLAQRGIGFGVPARLVDGNDILAVHAVMREAVDRARSGGGPTLVEAITHRQAAHSTADDPTRYCPPENLSLWEARDPLKRFRRFLFDGGYLDEKGDMSLVQEVEAYLTDQVQKAFDYPAPSPDGFFNNVYAELTPRLARQRDQVRQELGLPQ
jgi:TPP-dependent pyruvate/acetoin dehydrogenase alpha subunit